MNKIKNWEGQTELFSFSGRKSASRLFSEQLLARRSIGGHFARKPKKNAARLKHPGLFNYDLPGHKDQGLLHGCGSYSEFFRGLGDFSGNIRVRSTRISRKNRPSRAKTIE